MENEIPNFEKTVRLSLSFEDLERQLCSFGKYEFFGLPMSQIPKALFLISNLLFVINPTKIIEFGTGMGGLSVLLSIYANLKGIHFDTYDCNIHRQDVLRNLADSNSLRRVHLDTPETIHEITHSLLLSNANNGRNLLICDALKSEEFNRYAEFCKHGDVLLMHDYSRTIGSEQFKNTCVKYAWSAPQEQCYDLIKDACEKYNIIPFMHDEFEDVLWFCGIVNSPNKK